MHQEVVPTSSVGVSSVGVFDFLGPRSVLRDQGGAFIPFVSFVSTGLRVSKGVSDGCQPREEGTVHSIFHAVHNIRGKRMGLTGFKSSVPRVSRQTCTFSGVPHLTSSILTSLLPSRACSLPQSRVIFRCLIHGVPPGGSRSGKSYIYKPIIQECEDDASAE